MKIWPILFLLSLCYRLFPQEHFTFSSINTKHGLSDNRVHKISQMNDGRMLVVTEGLINIYDGTGFRYIHYNDQDAYNISRNGAVYQAYIDQNNYLWLKDHLKLFLFNLNKELFLYDIDSVFASVGIQDKVKDIYMDNKKDFWYITDKDELFYKQKEEKQARLFIQNVSNIDGVHDQLFDLNEHEGNIYLFYKSGRISCFKITTAEKLFMANYYEGSENLFYTALMTAFYKQYIYLLSNTVENGGLLVRFDLNTKKWKKLISPEKTWLNTITIDSAGTCWVSSHYGLWRMDQNLENIEQITHLNLNDGVKYEAEINTQFHDNNGGLWIGTLDRGLLYFHRDRFKFNQFGPSHFKAFNAENLRVTCFEELNDVVFIGTNNGLFQLSKKQQAISRIGKVPKNTLCNKLYKDINNRIWLCTDKNGLFSIKKGVVKHYDFKFRCQNLFESSDSICFMCTDEGFGTLDITTGTYKKIESSVQLGHIYQLMDFGENKLLGVSYGDAGLFVYDRKNDSYMFPDDNEYRMLRHSNKKCHDMLTDNRGLIWFATQDGLNVYDPSDNSSWYFNEADGLINNNIRSIVEDDNGRIWLSTSAGISCIALLQKNNRYTFSFLNYNLYDGVIENEFLPRSVFGMEDSSILWGGVGGFNELNPNKFNLPDQKLARPIFTKMLLFGKEVKVGKEYDGQVLLNQTISTTKTVELKHSQNFISFEVSALNYVNPTHSYYRYQLEGFDNSWHVKNPPDGLGRITYTKIPPGTYCLKVNSAVNNQQWNNQVAELNIVILPPFWKTGLALTFYIILIVGIVFFIVNSTVKKNKRRMLQKQKEEFDQMKLSFFTNISHELRTPITLILTPLESIIKKTMDKELVKRLSGIHGNAKNLLNLVNQLLDFRKLEMRGEKMHLSLCYLNEFLETLVNNFYEIAVEREIQLSFENHAKNLYVYADKDKLQKIINNLLTNALKYTQKKGLVKLCLSVTHPGFQEDSEIQIQVSDTGQGIAEEDQKQIFDRFYQTKQNLHAGGSGIGLHLVKQYVLMHKGSIEVKSQVNRGSTFTIVLPVNPEKSEEREIIYQKKNINPSIKILLVEDHIEFRTFLYNELSEYYNIILASNGKEGLQKARKHQPNLIVSDIMMPEMTGTEFCNILKKDLNISHIPIILLTAKSSEESQADGFKAGADAYITKPFNLDILLMRIQNLIDQQEQRKNRFKKDLIINPDSITLTDVDEELINKAIHHVEKNLDNTSYSVKQLSRDMFMDRTGLYRKLLAIVGQTPSEFIKSVRLKKAALLLEKGTSVSEVSGTVGFATTSYFTKCFQKEFGIKPSNYKTSKQQRKIAEGKYAL